MDHALFPDHWWNLFVANLWRFVKRKKFGGGLILKDFKTNSWVRIKLLTEKNFEKWMGLKNEHSNFGFYLKKIEDVLSRSKSWKIDDSTFCLCIIWIDMNMNRINMNRLCIINYQALRKCYLGFGPILLRKISFT